MRESVSRPGPQCLQSQPHNGQPGSGTPVGHSMEVGTQKVRPVCCRATGAEKVPRTAWTETSGLPALEWLAGILHWTGQTLSVV